MICVLRHVYTALGRRASPTAGLRVQTSRSLAVNDDSWLVIGGIRSMGTTKGIDDGKKGEFLCVWLHKLQGIHALEREEVLKVVVSVV